MDTPHPQSPIAQMSGSDLQRSLLLSLQEWRERLDTIRDSNPAEMDEETLAQFVRDTLVMQGNLAQLAAQCAVELGLPI